MPDAPYIAAAWHTPDYVQWADRLRASLDQHGEPHDIVAVPELPGGWEAATCRKPAMVRQFMDRHPSKVIVLLDVDCEVRGSLAALTDLRSDVAFWWEPRRRKDGHPKLMFASGTMVFKPTARSFVEHWQAVTEARQWGDNDQHTLMLAMEVPGVTFECLDRRWCATASNGCADPVIVHASASKTLPKISNTAKRLRNLWRRAA